MKPGGVMRLGALVAAIALIGLCCAKAPPGARAADPPAPDGRHEGKVATAFNRAMPRGPGVSFKRDLAALSVSIYAGPWRDLSINFPTLRALGLQGCQQIDLVIPIAACQFNPSDSEVHRCLGDATARFHLDDDKRIVPATRASVGTEELQRITVVDVSGAREHWRFRVDVFVCLNEKKCLPLSIELPK